MTGHRFVITYQTADERYRVVFHPALNGARWVRRVAVYEDGRWVNQSHDYITAPEIDVQPVGSSVFAGP